MIALSAGACVGSGSLDLTLQLPTDQTLQPSGETTVEVIATGTDGVPVANTSVIENNSFSAGDLPVGNDMQIDVLLRDVSNRLVGVGEAGALVDIKGDQTTSLTMPVRKPFVYAATDKDLYSFDPTLDSRDASFQGQLSGVSGPMFAVSAGGDLLAIVTSNTVQVVDTSTNMVTGNPIQLPDAANDASAVPGSHRIAVGTKSGITIVDLDAGTVASSSAGASVDRVTVGANGTGGHTAYGLISRVQAPSSPLDSCSGASSIVATDVDSPADATPVGTSTALSDIAADPQQALLFATDPCDGEVVRLDASSDSTAINATMVSALARANVLTVLGERIWAAGTTPAVPVCLDANGNTIKCNADSPIECPVTDNTLTNYVAYVTTGAAMVVQSIPTTGSDAPLEFDVPDRRETMVSLDDDAQQHAQVLRAFSAVPNDLVALPGGQFVSVVASSEYFIQELVETGGVGGDKILLPCLDGKTSDWLEFDMASLSIASRVRTECNLTVGQADPPFVDWGCDVPPANETSKFGAYTPASVGALFGAR
nr:hypothetical protein [Kofleriaceae bacterium]